MADSVNNNLLNTLGILQKTSGDAKPRNELGQTEFFELMVAQLQNQDPLSPMESNEFLSQIAQFSSVNGISAMQQAIEQMSASFQSNQALQPRPWWVAACWCRVARATSRRAVP